MKIQKGKIITLIASILLIVVVNIWMFQYPNTSETYYNLFFFNSKSFPIYHLTEWNFQYIMAFLLFHTIVIYTIIGDLYESDSFISFVLHRSGSVPCYQMLCKHQMIRLLCCMLCTWIMLNGLLVVRIGLNPELFQYFIPL